MNYLVYLPLVAGMLLGLYLPRVEEPARQAMLTGWAAILIGLTVALSGVRAIVRGEIRMRSRNAIRAESPMRFWVTVGLFRFAIAAMLIAGGVWHWGGEAREVRLRRTRAHISH